MEQHEYHVTFGVDCPQGYFEESTVGISKGAGASAKAYSEATNLAQKAFWQYGRNLRSVRIYVSQYRPESATELPGLDLAPKTTSEPEPPGKNGER